MRTAVVASHKGGCGKTSVAVNVAVGLARAGKRVLLVDADAQGSATRSLGVDPAESDGVFGLLVHKVKLADVLVSIEDGLDAVPGGRELSAVDPWLVSQLRREELLKRRLGKVGSYDFLIFDTAPGFSLLSLNAMVAATEMWVVASMDFLALEGLRQIRETVGVLRAELGCRLPIRYAIPNMHDLRHGRTLAVMAALKKHFGKARTPPIRIDTKLSEAPGHGQSIFDYAPRGRGAEDFKRLVERIKRDG